MQDNKTDTMTVTERIFHMVLFEVLLLILMTLSVLLFTQQEVGHVAGVAVALSVIAMAWNFIYNWIFDQCVTGKKENRSIKLRIFHAVTFEAGLLVVSLPLIAWVLNMSLWQAFIVDIGLTVLVVIYTFIFNYVYDHLRAALTNR